MNHMSREFVPGEDPVELSPVKPTADEPTDRLIVAHSEPSWLANLCWYGRWLLTGFVGCAIIDIAIQLFF